jgi:hypothetical protein
VFVTSSHSRQSKLGISLLFANIRQGFKWLEVTNIPVYNPEAVFLVVGDPFMNEL